MQPELTTWSRIRRIAGPKGTYLFGSITNIEADGEVGVQWIKDFRRQAEENSMSVRIVGGHLYLDRMD